MNSSFLDEAALKEKAVSLGLEKIFESDNIPTHCLLCRKPVGQIFAVSHTESCLRNYRILFNENKRKLSNLDYGEESQAKRTKFNSISSKVLPGDDEWDTTLAADITRENGLSEYPYNQDDFSQIPYQREKVRRQEEAQKKKEEKEAKKNQGNICFIHKIMSNRCSQDKTTQSPKSLTVIIGEKKFLICKYSHLSGNDMTKAVMKAWATIAITETEPAPNNQRCCNPRCKEKAPGVKFFRAGGRDMDQEKYWHYCQLRCLVTHLFETSTKSWEAHITGKHKSPEDKAEDLDGVLNELEL